MVAILVVESPGEGVGALGLPVNVGLAKLTNTAGTELLVADIKL